MHLSIRKMHEWLMIRCINAAFLVIFGVLSALCSTATATEHVCPTLAEIPEIGLSVRCSEPFIRVVPPPSPAMFAFRPSVGLYPTVNFILMPEPLELEASEQIARETVESYRRVGLKDTEVAANWVSLSWGVPHRRLLLHYTLEQQPFSALVALIPLPQSHAAMTSVAMGHKPREEMEEIAARFHVATSKIELIDPPESGGTGLLVILSVALMASLGALFISKTRRSRIRALPK